MKKILLLLVMVFAVVEVTDAQMMNQVNYSKLRVNSGLSVDDDIAYMKKRRKKRRKSSRGRGSNEQNVIKLNPFGIIWGNLLFYERALSDNISVQLGVGFYSRKTDAVFFGIGTEYKYSGFNLTPSVRYYFMGEAPRGFYGTLAINYLNRTEKVTSVGGTDDQTFKNKITGIGGAIGVGYQWIWNGGFSLDINAGAGYSSYNYKYDDGYEESGFTGGLDFSGFLPAFAIAVGYAF